MGSNDLPYRRKATEGWNNDKESTEHRLAVKRDAEAELDKYALTDEEAESAYIYFEHTPKSEDQKTIDRLKQELKEVKRERDKWHKAANMSYQRFWDHIGRVSEDKVKAAVAKARKDWEDIWL